MRLGEVLGLKRKCVFDDYVVINNSLQDINGKMVDTPPKTAAGEREITITRDLSSDLKKRFNSGKIVSFDGYIFQSKNGTPLRPNQIERAWKSILLLASVPHKKFHVLRHTHATQLLANGVPLLEVSKRLGHSRASHTLDLYGHAIPGYDASLPNKISKIFNL
ncbi:site-specific integrase [Phascolarctobacterium faecium]